MVKESLEQELKNLKLVDFKVKYLPDESYIIITYLNEVETLDSIDKIVKEVNTIILRKLYNHTCKVSVVVDWQTQKRMLSFDLTKIKASYTPPKTVNYDSPRGRTTREIKHTGPKVQVITENEADLLHVELRHSNFYSREVDHIGRVISDRIPQDESITSPEPVLDAIYKDASRYWSTDNRLIEVFKFEGGKFIVRYLSISNPKTYYFCRGIEEIRRIDFTK